MSILFGSFPVDTADRSRTALPSRRRGCNWCPRQSDRDAHSTRFPLVGCYALSPRPPRRSGGRPVSSVGSAAGRAHPIRLACRGRARDRAILRTLGPQRGWYARSTTSRTPRRGTNGCCWHRFSLVLHSRCPVTIAARPPSICRRTSSSSQWALSRSRGQSPDTDSFVL